MIESGVLKPGDALPPERALAEELGVARKTVRAALEDLVAQGMVEAPAPGRRRSRVAPPTKQGKFLAHTIVLVSDLPPHANGRGISGTDAYAALCAQVTVEFQAQGLHVLRLSPERLHSEGLGPLLSQGPMGVLATARIGESAGGGGHALFAECRRERVPLVCYGDTPALEGCDRVALDEAQGAADLVRWLIGHGCRRIGRFWRVSEPHAGLAARDTGFARACAEAGVPVLPAILPPRLPSVSYARQSTREDFLDVVRSILGFLYEPLTRSDPIDALMVATDGQAYEVAAACRLLGKIPNREVRIVGYDNNYREVVQRQWESAGPAATIDVCHEALAHELARLLLERVAGKLGPEPQCRLVAPRLVVVEAGT
jgi:DNA-binding LacI/PurR family transcriptional regulator